MDLHFITHLLLSPCLCWHYESQESVVGGIVWWYTDNHPNGSTFKSLVGNFLKGSFHFIFDDSLFSFFDNKLTARTLYESLWWETWLAIAGKVTPLFIGLHYTN